MKQMLFFVSLSTVALTLPACVSERSAGLQYLGETPPGHKGKIREQGTHEELLERRGLYWRLYQLQYAAEARAA